MSKKSDYIFTFNLNGKTIKLLTISEKKSYDLTIIPKFAEFYREFDSLDAGPKIKEQHYSVHCSPRSAENLNVIKQTLKFVDGRIIESKHFTKALKQNDAFAPLYVCRSPDLSNERYTINKSKELNISLGDYNPKTVLYYMVFVGNISNDFNIPKKDFNSKTVLFSQFSFTILWSFGLLPSDVTGDKKHFFTLPNNELTNQLSEGYSPAEIAHLFQGHRQFLHDKYFNQTLKRNPSFNETLGLSSIFGFSVTPEMADFKIDEDALKVNEGYQFVQDARGKTILGNIEGSFKDLRAAEAIFTAYQLFLPLATTFLGLGMNNQSIGNIEEAISYIDKALEIYKTTSNIYLECETHIYRGMIYRDQGLASSARDCYEKAFSLAVSMEYRQLVNRAKLELGIIAMNVEENSKANELFEEVLSDDLDSDDVMLRATTLGNLGLLNLQESNLDEALIKHNEALSLYQSIQYCRGVANETANLGSVHLAFEQLEQSSKYLLEALRLHREEGYKFGIATDLKLLGILYSKLGDGIKTESFLKESVRVFEEINNFWQADVVKGFLTTCLK